jgi:hypothetical protein
VSERAWTRLMWVGIAFAIVGWGTFLVVQILLAAGLVH